MTVNTHGSAKARVTNGTNVRQTLSMVQPFGYYLTTIFGPLTCRGIDEKKSALTYLLETPTILHKCDQNGYE